MSLTYRQKCIRDQQESEPHTTEDGYSCNLVYVVMEKDNENT